MRLMLVILIALAGCSGEPESRFAFRDVSVRLPEDTAVFPVRAGSDAMNANCSGCHSTSMILFQPALTTEEWKAEIKKMREVYKAPINPADEAAILAYLEATSAALGPPEVAPTR